MFKIIACECPGPIERAEVPADEEEEEDGYYLDDGQDD